MKLLAIRELISAQNSPSKLISENQSYRVGNSERKRHGKESLFGTINSLDAGWSKFCIKVRI